jgi:hypothetical protein
VSNSAALALEKAQKAVKDVSFSEDDVLAAVMSLRYGEAQ